MLGSILLDEVVYPGAAAVLSPDDFSLEKHRRIFRRMNDLYARGEHIDRVTIADELQRRGELESVDGFSYLISLDQDLPHVPHIDGYVGLLREKSALRRIIFACNNVMRRAMANGESSAEIADAAQGLFTDIAARRQGQCKVTDIPSVRDSEQRNLEYIREPELPKGALVALTGDSAAGKSTLATAWARDAAEAFGVPTLFLDRENPAPVIVDRLDRLRMTDGELVRFWGGWRPEEAPQPDSPVVLDWVATCEPRPIVVVDSFAAFHGGDQNDAGQTRAFMHRCRRIADKGATVIVIHHDGKAETAKDYRGSSDFKAAIDLGFHVSNFGADGKLDRLILRPFKTRIHVGGEISYSYADGRFVRGATEEARETVTEQLTMLLRMNPGVKAKRFEDLANDKGLGRNRARTFLNDGLLAGSIRRENGPNNTKCHFLANAGSEL